MNQTDTHEETEGRAAFLNAGACPREARRIMVAHANQAESAFQVYDAMRGSHSVRMVEQLHVGDGLIRSSTLAADRAALPALLQL
jgi:hypothetical protein